MPTVWPATRVRRLLATVAALSPASDAISRRRRTSTVGLSGLMLASRSTRPTMGRTRSITCFISRSSSARSSPCSENSICLLPPTGSSRPAWVTVMPGTVRRRSRSFAAMASAFRLRSWRSTRRT